MSKTYAELREQTELNEGLFRKGATLVYASQVKQSGSRVEQNISKSKQFFSAAKNEKEIVKKMDIMMNGFSSIGDAIIEHRKMIGNLTGLSLSAALFVERTDAQIIKLIKGKR